MVSEPRSSVAMHESVSSPPTPPTLNFGGVALTKTSTILSGGECYDLNFSALGKGALRLRWDVLARVHDAFIRFW